MSGRHTKLFAAVLALAFNIAGGPMAWAQVAVSDSPPGGDAQVQHCADTAGDSAPGSPPPSCCDAGSCHCGCLPSALTTVLPILRQQLVPMPEMSAQIHAVPAEPLEDPLRPPIH
jgi:hypothetical protein